MVITTRSNSGLVIGKWLERVIAFRESKGVIKGYFFTNHKEEMMRAKNLKVDILDRIVIIQQRYPELIRPGVEVYDEYRLSKSFRRGSNSVAQNRGISNGDIDYNNRWRKVVRSGARKLKLCMREHYINVLFSLESFFKILAGLM